MASRNSQTRRAAVSAAFCGMVVALSVVLLLLSGTLVIATYAAPLLAGILLIPVLLEFGRKYAWLCWLAVSLLILILGIDKEAAFFYLFIGWYPILKPYLDLRVRKPLQPILKGGIFVFSVGVMYTLLCFLIPVDRILQDFGEMGTVMTVLFFVLMVFCLFVYDILLTRLALIYQSRIRPKLHLR